MFSSGPVRCFVSLLPEPGRGLSIGFGVTRAVRSAVIRNRIRRLMRESVRHYQKPTTGPGTRDGASAEIVLMYVGRSPEKASTVRLADMENSVAHVLASVLEYCEAGQRRAGSAAH